MSSKGLLDTSISIYRVTKATKTLWESIKPKSKLKVPPKLQTFCLKAFQTLSVPSFYALRLIFAEIDQIMRWKANELKFKPAKTFKTAI